MPIVLSPVKRALLVVIAYSAAAYIMVCGFTSPARLFRDYIGAGEVVLWSNHFWWFQHALFDLKQWPFQLSHLFVPLRLGIYDGSLPLLVFAPISRWFGSIFAYNAYVLCTFAWAGIAAHGLARHLNLSSPAAFLAGFLFAFSAKHFAHAHAHLHIYSIYWIPLITWAVLRLLRQPTWRRTGVLALLAAGTALTSWTIAIISGILALVLFLAQPKAWRDWNILGKMAVALLAALILAAPGIFWLVRLQDYAEAKYGYAETLQWSTDVLAFFTPSPCHRLLGSLASPVWTRFPGNEMEATAYLGIVGIVLTMVVLVWPAIRRVWKAWIAALAVFIVLPLGPVLHVAGAARFTEAQITVALPGALLQFLPVLEMMRAPNRYAMGTTLVVAVLAAVAFDAIRRRLRGRPHAAIAFPISVFAAALLDSAYRLPLVASVATPQIYHTMAQDPVAGAVIEVPAIRSPLLPDGVPTLTAYYEHQKHHQRPLVGGYFERVNAAHLRFATSDPVLHYLWTGLEDITLGPIFDQPLAYLATFHDVRYLVVHPRLLRPEVLQRLVAFLGSDYEADESAPGEPVLVYRTMPLDRTVSPVPVRLKLEEGWHIVEYWPGEPLRWMKDQAEVVIDVTTSQDASLAFLAKSAISDRTLVAELNGVVVARVPVPSDEWTQAEVPLRLEPGTHRLRLTVPEGAVRPSDVIPNSPDGRELAIAIRPITLARATDE